MKDFDLRKYLKEGKLHENEMESDMSLEILDGESVELTANSGTYFAYIEDNGTVDFSVVYDDVDYFGEDNWKDILGPNHAFVEIANKIPTKVEALDDYVMITVDLEDLKSITNNK